MNLTRSQKVRLGAFMLTGTGLLVGGIVLLLGVSFFEPRDTYTVRFTESVGGLEPSAQVKYRGVRVGRIERLRIAPHSADAVDVVLALQPGTPLYEGVQAVLDSSGLTGLKTVNLIGGDPEAGLLPEGSEIPAGKSFFSRVTGQAEQIAMKLETVVNELVSWTDDKSRTRVMNFIDSLNRLANESAIFLHTTRDPFANALNGVDHASKVVASLTGEVQNTLATVRNEAKQTLQVVRRPLEQVNPKELAETVQATRDAMRNLDRRLSDAETGQLLTSLQGTTRDMQRVVQDLEIAVRAGREDFVSTLSYLRQAAEDMREFSRIIAQDPSTLLRGKEISQ